jgi:hypothetical protein
MALTPLSDADGGFRAAPRQIDWSPPFCVRMHYMLAARARWSRRATEKVALAGSKLRASGLLEGPR